MRNNMSLDDELDMLSELFSAKQAVFWELGDRSAELVRLYGRGIIGKIAEIGRCSKERIRQLIVVATTFPKEQRYPDIDFSIYRECYNAARRTELEPVEILKHVLDNELSLADIAAMGKVKERKAKLSKTCEWCNSKITVTADGGLAGTRIYCPVCLEDGQKNLVGVLEND